MAEQNIGQNIGHQVAVCDKCSHVNRIQIIFLECVFLLAFSDALKLLRQTVINSLTLRYTKIAFFTALICITTVNNDSAHF